ncbi:CAP domain-containing protein [Qipengyuania atrilutea]|uniref:CAP domain-containing protein n=1 Tax=Qipengyuania atrilutea TaxID=2744473 RepID=UPI00298E5C5F|nr:CAP domain-containing protein [Actirhodobacter atriluteus]
MTAPLLVGAQGVHNDFEQRLLASHNRERATLKLPELRWDSELARGAKQWAEELAATGKFEHSPGNSGTEPLGENLWGGTPGHFQPEAMVGLWIEEKEHFKPGRFPNVSITGDHADVGHYTQVMWRKTRAVGCARATGADEEILVCRYSRAGNIRGQKVF